MDAALHLGARRAVFQRVVQDVGQRAAQQGAVTVAERHFRGVAGAHGDALLACQHPGVVDGFFQHTDQVQQLVRQRLRLGAGQLDKALGHAEGCLGVALNARQQFGRGELFGVGAPHVQQGQDGRIGCADVVRDEIQRLIAQRQRAADVAQIDQRQQPAGMARNVVSTVVHVIGAGKRLALQQQAAPLRVLALAVRWHAALCQRLRGQQGLLVGGGAQVLQQLGSVAALQGARAGAVSVSARGGVGQHHLAGWAAHQDGRGQLLQAFADKAVQFAQLLRGLFDCVHAPLQKIAAHGQGR